MNLFKTSSKLDTAAVHRDLYEVCDYWLVVAEIGSEQAFEDGLDFARASTQDIWKVVDSGDDRAVAYFYGTEESVLAKIIAAPHSDEFDEEST